MVVIMLLQFRFQNYKSFKNECQIDFMASSEKSHENHYVEMNGQKVLTTVAMYGNNASGKSTCISALQKMGRMVLNSIIHEDISDFEIKPFQFSPESRDMPTTFEIFFTMEQYEYQYGFVVNMVQNRIQEEWLYKKKFSKNKTMNRCIFERKDKKLMTENKKLKALFEIVDSNVLFATLLGRRHIKEASAVFDFFGQCKYLIDSQPYSRVETRVGQLLKEKPDIKKRLETLLKEIDPCLKKLQIQEKEGRQILKHYKLFGIHDIEGEDSIALPLIEESEGTIKCIRVLPYIIQAFLEGGLIVIDEFDAQFHPLVYRKIISLFYDKNVNEKNAQLLFTTHSTFMLNSNDIRRDQVLLVEKDKNGVSSLYSLADFNHLRIDANYEKKYLAGEFGSIPFQHERDSE